MNPTDFRPATCRVFLLLGVNYRQVSHAGLVPLSRLSRGRKVVAGCRLLRNSTKIAAQFLGLRQCSQKAPAPHNNLKRDPIARETAQRDKAFFSIQPRW
jgi:hypothetical protein